MPKRAGTIGWPEVTLACNLLHAWTWGGSVTAISRSRIDPGWSLRSTAPSGVSVYVCGCGGARIPRLTRVRSNRVRAVASAPTARANAAHSWGAASAKTSAIPRRAAAATARVLHRFIHICIMTSCDDGVGGAAIEGWGSFMHASFQQESMASVTLKLNWAFYITHVVSTLPSELFQECLSLLEV